MNFSTLNIVCNETEVKKKDQKSLKKHLIKYKTFPFKISQSKCGNYLKIPTANMEKHRKHFYLKLVIDKVAHQHCFYLMLSLSFWQKIEEN